MYTIKDNLSNFSSIVMNTIKNNKNELIVPYNELVYSIVHLLYKEGYVVGYKIMNINNSLYVYSQLRKQNGLVLIHKIKRVSKPSQKKYCTLVQLKKIYSFCNGDTNYIISTSKGIFSGKTCIERGLSGELLVKIN